MATYKVPQDVEADDKLIGPFSFRQFIYLIIVAMAIALAWGLAQLFIGLAIIPLPIIIFFGTLALPLRKDQPMEIYMAAIVSFYLKPRNRLWDPDGVESLIEVTAPKTVEVRRAKEISQSEAAQRLNYLANIVDTQGWAIRGVNGAGGTAMNNDAYLEAQSAEDILDTNTSVAQGFDQLMNASTEKLRQEARERMMQASMPAPAPQAPPQAPPQQAPAAQPVAAPAQTAPQQYVQQAAQQPAPAPQQAPAYQPPVVSEQPQAAPHYDPYPNSMRQTVVQPLNDALHRAEQPATSPKPEEKPPTTSDSTPSADIISLANNPDLSIETIAHEASRRQSKASEDSEEVVISLR